MQTLEGRATGVESSVLISGGERSWTDEPAEPPGLTSVTYLARFELEARVVRVRSRELVRIGEGDRVLVAGVARRGSFEAMAYRNLSTFEQGDRGWFPELAAGIACGAVGAFMAWQSLGSGWSLTALVLAGALLAPASLYLMFVALRVRAAALVLRRHPS